MIPFRARHWIGALAALAALAGCGAGARQGDPDAVAGPAYDPSGGARTVPGRIPPPLDPTNVYAADRAGMLSPAVRGDPALVYVPNSNSNTVDVISQRTFTVVAHFAVGAHQTAHGRFAQAVELAETDLPSAAVEVLLDDAVASRITVGPVQSLRLIGRARDLGHRLDARTRRRIEALYGWTQLQAGHAEQLGALEADLRKSAADPIGQLSTEGWSWDLVDAYGNIAIATERFADARAVLEPALTAAEHAGAVEAAVALSVGNAVLLSRTGPLDKALVLARRAVELAELVPMIGSFAALAQALILLGMGQTAEGTRCCALAESTATRRREHLALPWIWHLRAQQCLHAGRVGQACDLYDRIDELSAQLGIGDPCLVLWARHAIATYLADQRVDAASRVIDWLENCENRLLSRWPRIAAATGRAWRSEHYGDHDQAVLHFRVALALHDEVELPMEEAETLLAYGAFLRRQGQRTAARAPLAEAVRIAEQNQAGRIAEEARAELSIAGGRRRRAQRNSQQLTAQEQRVATLAAAGHTNKQIAGTLSLSVKTIEYHLQQIYGKLGINSRRQLMTMTSTATPPTTDPDHERPRTSWRPLA